jgi:hypothetical protein
VPKKAAVYTKEYININENCKSRAQYGIRFSSSMKTDKIKTQNSSLEVQNRNLVYLFSVNHFSAVFVYHKAQKSKNRALYKQQQLANEEI